MTMRETGIVMPMHETGCVVHNCRYNQGLAAVVEQDISNRKVFCVDKKQFVLHVGMRGRAPFPQSRMPASIEEFNKAKCMYGMCPYKGNHAYLNRAMIWSWIRKRANYVS